MVSVLGAGQKHVKTINNLIPFLSSPWTAHNIDSIKSSKINIHMAELVDYKNELNTHVVKNNLIDKIVEKINKIPKHHSRFCFIRLTLIHKL